MKDNPLIGKNEHEIGVRFPDMSMAYDQDLIEKALRIAEQHGIKLQKGVYAADSGPTFETPAEYKYIRAIGADAVGMSTVPEVIVANHMGMKVFAISVITNNGLVPSEEGNKHNEVLDVATLAGPKLDVIFGELISSI